MSNNIQNIGLKGIHEGMAKIAEKADRISKSFTSENSEDPTEDIIGMKLDENQVKASKKVIQTGNELDKSILDILA